MSISLPFLKRELSSQITGLTQPALLERMSEVLMQTGSHLDRGRSSGNLTGFMKNQLDPAEFEAFQNLWSRLDKLALAVQQKVEHQPDPER